MVFRRITRIIEVVLNERAVSETEKKSEIIWKVFIKTLIFAAFSEENTKKFGLWCNGSTTGFGSVCPGSNPGSPTFFKTFIVKSPLKRHFSGLFCYPDNYKKY